MILEYIHKDSSREIIDINLNKDISDSWININSPSKKEFIKEFLPAFSSGQKIVLFDKNHKKLQQFYEENNLNDFEGINDVNKTAQILFFTSGSSGFPVGAFKSKDNLLKEVEILKDLLSSFNIKRVVVSVQFVHIYGVLAGLLLPLYLNNVSLIVKEDFLPYELLEEALHNDTLIITTPLFIKALSKVSTSKELTRSLFISSTGPLHIDDVRLFENKFETSLLQLFGSTETGGIAYKFSTESKWTSLEDVHISTKDDKLNIVSPFISPFILNKKLLSLEQPFTTEDIIELDENGFTLIGRSNKIIKIAGKRISSVHIESILETINGVDKAIVELVYKKDLLRSEQILITLESSVKIKRETIKQNIRENYGVLTIPFTVNYVDKINYSSMGKKFLF